MKYLVAIVLVLAGFYFVMHSFSMVRTVGKAAWAERYLGDGGSYTMWKLVGLLCILSSIAVIRMPQYFGLSGPGGTGAADQPAASQAVEF